MERGYLKVVNNTVVPKSIPRLTQGSLNTIELEWEFPEMWNNFGKRATFSIGGTTVFVQIVDSRCIIPELSQTGKLDIGCYLYETQDNTYTAICSAHPYTCYVSRGSFSADIEENTESAERYVQAAGEYAQQALDTRNSLQQVVQSLSSTIEQAYNAENYLNQNAAAAINAANALNSDLDDARELKEEFDDIISAEASLRNSLQAGNALNAELEDVLTQLQSESDLVRRSELAYKADKTDLNVSGFRYHYSPEWNILSGGATASVLIEPVDSCEDTVYYVNNIPQGITLSLMAIISGSDIGSTYSNFQAPITPNGEVEFFILQAQKNTELTAEELNEIDFSQSVRYYTVSQIDSMLSNLSTETQMRGTALRMVTQSNNTQTVINKNEVNI